MAGEQDRRPLAVHSGMFKSAIMAATKVLSLAATLKKSGRRPTECAQDGMQAEENDMLDTTETINPPTGQFNSLRRVLNSSTCDLDYKVSGAAAARSVRLQRAHFDGIDVIRYESLGLRSARRGHKHIRSDQLDDFLISLPIHAPLMLTQDGRQTRVEPGDFVFMATGKPFEASGEPDSQHPFAEIIVRISGPLLRGRMVHIDDCCSRSIKVRQGAGKIMQSLFEQALQQGRDLSQHQKTLFAGMLLDAIVGATLEAPELVALSDRPRTNPTDRIREQAISYISMHLSNPDLCAREIADHCGISVRYLYAAFAAASMKVGDLIREMRLQACRNALRSSTLRHRTNMEIVTKWGFNDCGNFSRLYKSRFGVTPTEDRKNVLEKLS